jgi:hypothetical protein
MRTVIESLEVSAKVDAASAQYPRAEDAFEAAKWWLARSPDSGYCIDDFNWLYKQKGNSSIGVPVLVILYTFDHRSVTINSIEIRMSSV